jgi:ATP:corrinoid adenosyltransferase
MSTAAAQMIATPDTMPPDMIDTPVDQIEADQGAPSPLLDEIRVGFEQLRAMSHDELRDVINKRVMMLETVLRERDERRAAIDTAKLATRMLEVRRHRAVRIHKNVNLGSALAALASTLLIVAVMI